MITIIISDNKAMIDEAKCSNLYETNVKPIKPPIMSCIANTHLQSLPKGGGLK